MAIVVRPPALDAARGVDGAVVHVAGTQMLECARGWTGLSVVVVAPALNGAHGVDAACVLTAGTYTLEGACGWGHFAPVVATPALDGTRGVDAARVERASSTHTLKGSRRRRRAAVSSRAIVSRTPALDGTRGFDAARESPTRSHALKSAGGWACLAGVISAPATDPVCGVDGAGVTGARVYVIKTTRRWNVPVRRARGVAPTKHLLRGIDSTSMVISGVY